MPHVMVHSYRRFNIVPQRGLSPKRWLSAFAIAMLALFSAACDTTLGTRSFTDPLPQITVPGAPVPSALRLALGVAIPNPAIDLASGSSFVTFVAIRNLTISILDISELDSNDDGAEDSFDFLAGLDVSIRANFDGRTNELLIGTLPDGDPQFGGAARDLTLTVVNPNTNVLRFLEASDGYEVILNMTGTIPADDIIVSGAIRYRVGLGLDI